MAKLSKPIRQFLYAILALLLSGLVGLWVLYSRLKADDRVRIVGPPNSVDAAAAVQKIEVFEKALREGREGFVSLSEVEVNSFLLLKHVRDYQPREGESDLIKCRLFMVEGGDLQWSCWFMSDVGGKAQRYVWTRVFRVDSNAGNPRLSLLSMKLGKVGIPERFWPDLNAAFGDVDHRFRDSIDWLADLPRSIVDQNELGNQGQIKLYTYESKLEQSAGHEIKLEL
jgi:hypothetical protein